MMSMFSPPRREKSRGEDSHLPKGDCRYILLHPEVKGLRCACVGFALNRGIPGSTCDCGHQACYHAADQEIRSIERRELEALKEKVAFLEGELERQVGRPDVVDRLGRLEECLDKSMADNEGVLKNMSRGMSGLWYKCGQLEKRTPYYDDHIEGLVDDVQRMRNRLIEVDDASMRLEDRVEALERSSNPIASVRSRRRKASTPPSAVLDDYPDYPIRTEAEAAPSIDRRSGSPLHIVTSEEPSNVQLFRERVSSVGSGSEAWTVHISLLPTSSQPFPFEKDTAAYKRCLSRGLHRVVAIPDSDSHSFKTAVSEAFSEILRGRSWVPLVARICDAKNLRGLPMLRQLPDWLEGGDYDAGFLQSHCAVTDESGTILDLYIAMSDDTISWAELKELKPFLDGLEASWTYDPFLDGPCLDDGSDALNQDIGVSEKRPAAGDILPWSPSLKRKESEISRTPSFGSSNEGEVSRVKFQRPCPAEVVGRLAEAV